MSRPFSTKSALKLQECHPDLIKIAKRTLAVCPVDFGISEGHRSFDKQLEYFLSGTSRLDPRVVADALDPKYPKHMMIPSMAFDIYAYVPGHPDLTYDPEHLTHIAGYMLSSAEYLLAQGKITHRLVWGGNWDSDGTILRDHKLWDRPHFELRNPL